MEDILELTIDIAKEQLSTGEDVYVATFREVDLASQGGTVEEAKENAIEAFMLWRESASQSEIERRLLKWPRRSDVFTTRVEIPFGQTEGLIRGLRCAVS